MSQLSTYGSTGSKQITGLTVDTFATLDITTAIANTFTTGELITGETSGATAKVSGIIDTTTLRLKGVKPNPTTGAFFADGEVIRGNKSDITATTDTTAYVVERVATREAATVANTGTASYTFDTVAVTDAGLTKAHRDSTEMMQGLRMALSKTQATDTTVVPTMTWTLPADGTYSIASGTLMKFIWNSNEALVVTGSPRIAVADIGNRVLVTGNLSFSDTKTITRVTGTWTADVIGVGSRIAITASVSNNSTFTVVSVDVTGKIATVTEAVVTEGAVGATATAQGTTVYAYYNPDASSSTQLSFEYRTVTPVNPGQIASATYQANSGTIKDVGGAVTTITPGAFGSLTGIVFGA